jgi:CubicO group peptidase (beta-lactamase class C family)
MIGRRPMLLGATLSSLWACGARAQNASDFSGAWFGALELGSTRVRLRLVLEEGPRAVLYSMDQGNSAIPAGETRIDGDRIRLSFPAINARYEGRLSGARIEGEFTQGRTMPLIFSRGENGADAIEPLSDARLEALRASADAPALAAAALNIATTYSVSAAQGVRELGRSERVTVDDKWHLGSITKSMTATLVAQCVEAGEATWDDTVAGVLGAVIPDMRAEYRDVTFRHLLSHRAGLLANIGMADLLRFPRESADSREDRIAYARTGLRQAPRGPKEQTFEYSNTGYVIAGAMLEAKIGAP